MRKWNKGIRKKIGEGKVECRKKRKIGEMKGRIRMGREGAGRTGGEGKEGKKKENKKEEEGGRGGRAVWARAKWRSRL